MALVNSLKLPEARCGPKRAADYTASDSRPECLNRVTSLIDDTRTGCWCVRIIARGTASPVTASLRSHVYLVVRWARHTAEQ